MVLAGALAIVAAAGAVIGVMSIDPATEPAPSRSGDLVASGVDLKAAAASQPVANPERWVGPQGRIGQFVVTCRYTHSAPDDPIVHPGMSGMSHRHDFYGSKGVDASSTARSLLNTETTCNKTVDTAAYWQPTLYDHGKVIVPVEINAYYRAAPGVDPKTVATMPVGLSLITGDFTSTTPQPGDATGWTCGSSGKLADDPPTCSSNAPLHLVLTFPDCWDGHYLDSVDHHSHVGYSRRGRCPTGLGVHIPQITGSIKFPISGAGHDLTLASGNIYSAHGDFFNAWDPAGLRREIDHCIHRNAVCDLASNREEEALFEANP
ncbi:MAG: hypothetical protein JWM89_871 [Acidimicrobiales bacterium]|nr:hypothetical protein [Acidimicrobiales bacterium]